MVLLMLVVLLLCVSYMFPFLLKRYIERHSEEWIGRRIIIDRIVLNPFTLRYGIDGLTCYEPHSDKVFVSWKRISLRSNLWQGVKHDNWRLSALRVESLNVHVVQSGDRFNFSDLLELGGAETAAADDDGAVSRFSMEDIELSDGRIEYLSDVLAAPLVIHDIKATSSLVSTERARMDFGLSLLVGEGGRLDGGFMLDTESKRYAIDAELKAFSLRQLLPYLQEFFACKDLDGALDVDLKLVDSYADSTGLAISGGLGLSGVRLLDPSGEQLFGLPSASARLDTLVAREQRVEMGAVQLGDAEVSFVLLEDGTDNWTRLLKLDSVAAAGDRTTTQLQVSESNVFVMLAEYIRYLGEQVVASEYSAKRIGLSNAAVRFEDHTPSMPFKYAISEIDIVANSFTSAQEAGRVVVSAVLQETGSLKADVMFDTKDIRNTDVDLEVAALDLRALDAYGRWFAAHPLEEGTLRYTTHTAIHDGRIDSENRLRIDDLRLGKRVDEHDPDIYVLPLRLAVGLLKDVDGVIELDVPVSGDLKDPEFKPWPIVWQVLKNLAVKAASAPGRLLTRAFEGADEDDLERIRFEHMQTELTNGQARTLRQLVRALVAKSELMVDLVSVVDSMAETHEVALFEAKRAYVLPDRMELSGQDSAHIEGVSPKDSSFVRFVGERTPSLDGKPIRERCLGLVGADEASRIQGELEYARREIVMQFLLAEGLPAARVRYREGTKEELAGQRGAPGFRFVFTAIE